MTYQVNSDCERAICLDIKVNSEAVENMKVTGWEKKHWIQRHSFHAVCYNLLLVIFLWCLNIKQNNHCTLLNIWTY